MKVSLNLISDFVDISQKDINEIVQKLDNAGTEVSNVVELDYSGIIVGEILEITPHTNADRLNIAKIKVGANNIKQIIFGKSERMILAAGDKIPAAIAPAIVPNGMIIERREMRGELSEGMICVNSELGLDDKKEFITKFAKNTAIGKLVNQLLPINDTILELEITPNRGDLLSHFGVARELSAILNLPLKNQIINEFSIRKSTDLRVSVKNKELCPRYCARTIKNIRITDSPDWLQQKLLKCGIKPINNIVDVTNYIMLLYGQPMHAFDLSKISNNQIIIRNAKDKEIILDLNNTKHMFTQNNLIISDDIKPLAIAGIIGGIDSGICEKTQSIVLEAAYFNQSAVRLTAKQLKISTDASYRFERSIDASFCAPAIDYATQLILDIAGGEAEIIIDKNYLPQIDKIINLNVEHINSILDIKLTSVQITKILIGLGFTTDNKKIIVPPWRNDINIEQDIAEEIGRIYGYDNLPKRTIQSTLVDNTNASYIQTESLKDILIDCGLTEVYNPSFVSEKDIQLFNIKSSDIIEVSNPLSPENKYLRPNLEINLIKAAAKNPSVDSIEIFEIGDGFFAGHESTQLAILTAGKTQPLKNIINQISAELNIDAIQMLSIGKLTTVNKNILNAYKIRKPSVNVYSIKLSKLIEAAKISLSDFAVKKNIINYKSIAKFPSVRRDIAIIVDKNIDKNQISKFIRQFNQLIATVELFDEFESPKFGADKKSIAFHIDYISASKTLTNAEVETVHQKLIQKINEQFNAKLRS